MGKRIAIGGCSFLAAALIAVTVWIATYDGRKDIDLAGWVGQENTWHRSMMPGASWATDELRSVELPCIQAVTSTALTMHIFAERDDAVVAARSFGEDGCPSGWIAVRHEPGGLTAGRCDDLESGLGCINTAASTHGPGHDPGGSHERLPSAW